MKKLAIFMLAAIALLCLLPTLANCQKEEKQKLKYDTLTKTLTRERTIVVSEVIDTARLYGEDSRLTAEIDLLQIRRDSIRAQIKTARKLMTGKKGGGGNNRAAEAPPIKISVVPPCDSTATFESGPVVVCWRNGAIQSVACFAPSPTSQKPKVDKPKTKAKKQ